MKIWTPPKSSIKIPLPNITQNKNYNCGIVINSIFKYYGINLSNKKMEDELHISKIGTDPYQFIAVIEKYNLNYIEYNFMSKQQLKFFIDAGKPTIVTIQAWGKINSYKDNWSNGHWVAAIGYDNDGFYFEDPVLKNISGFIPYQEFEERWHDTGDNDFPEDHYGLVIWGNSILNSKNLISRKATLIL